MEITPEELEAKAVVLEQQANSAMVNAHRLGGAAAFARQLAMELRERLREQPDIKSGEKAT